MRLFRGLGLATGVLGLLLVAGCGGLADVGVAGAGAEAQALDLGMSFVTNERGVAASYSPLGPIDELRATNAFFKDMGTSGRTCISCHGEEAGWTPPARHLWRESNGEDPLFQFTHDVGSCPEDRVDKKGQRRKTMKALIKLGSARGGNPIGPDAEFEAIAVDDPYDCDDTSLSLFFGYREPNPIASASQKASLTWAGGPPPGGDMHAQFKGLMIGATQFHGLTDYVPTDEEQTQGADFAMNLFFAQIEDEKAGRLDADGARGGPFYLSQQEWFPGINHASTGSFDSKIFDIYDAWIDIDPRDYHGKERKQARQRRLIAEGQELFNFRTFGNGFTCGGCHNSPNVGSSSVFRLIDIGTVDIPHPLLASATLRNKATGEIRTVTNLGLAASTGKWDDIGRMKVPILRGLKQRAPYFHGGQAETFKDVLNHYNQRFNIGFTNHEKKALAAFLGAL